MLDLTAPVSKLAGIGPQIEKLLNKLSIYTIADLVNYYPSRHIDYDHPTKIAFLKTGHPGNFIATIDQLSQFTTKTGKPTTQAIATDDTGSITLTWFYSRFISRVIQEGQSYHIAGTPIRWGKNLSIISPQIEPVGSDSLHTTGLVPTYPLTAGITANRLRRFIKTALSQAAITDNLPTKQIKSLQLPNLSTALHNIHFPTDQLAQDLADRRLSFNKHLSIALTNLAQLAALGTSPALSIDRKLEAKVIKSLPFQLTLGQKKAIADIYSDLQSSQPTHRLIQGDTGSGKTLLAVFAALAALSNKYSFILMAPTQILANQHYLTFQKLLKTKDIHLITSSTPIKKFPNQPGVFIGTHALLNRIPTQMKHPPAAIFIDEQHKFGVKQRQLLQNRKPHPHIFNLTATPIPRTIALGLFGEIDISTIKSKTQKDKDIKTFVVNSSYLKEKGFPWVKKRLQQKDKIFVVAPLIKQGKTSLSSAEAIHKLYQKSFGTDFPVYLLHGRIKEDQKQKIINQFKSQPAAILVATPVIEVGIDIADATTIIIHSAERFGLASLHQLRGRVARHGGVGYCFLVPTKESQEETARLTLLTKYKSGLTLAKMDLKLRGAGKIFGTSQHGHFPTRLKYFWSKDSYQQAKNIAKTMLK